MIDNKLDLAWKLIFEKRDYEKALENFLNIAKDQNLTKIIRSEAYRGAGEIILCYASYLDKADAGYTYFKKAIELDCNNLQARVSFVYLFFDPEGNFEINEKEFLENIIYLLNIDLDKLNDRYDDQEKKQIEDKIKKNIKSYFYKRLEKLNKN